MCTTTMETNYGKVKDLIKHFHKYKQSVLSFFVCACCVLVCTDELPSDVAPFWGLKNLQVGLNQLLLLKEIKSNIVKRTF